MIMMKLFILVLVLVFFSPHASPDNCGVSFVLLGFTGDLARRYLWPALFQIFMETECLPRSVASSSMRCGLVVVGGSKEPVRSYNSAVWREVLGGGVQCETISCELCLDKFIRSSLKLKIYDEEDYKSISRTLSEANERLNQTEVGRIFYLSVPPSAYPTIVKYIHLYGRPESTAWMRVVLEKPFGNDLSSAELLAKVIGQYLEEEEVYRVDHYLRKYGVQQILPFRCANSAKLGLLWNRDHIQHIEVSLKERLDIKDRSGFFDKYGIIRDVHQSHLTEILARVGGNMCKCDDGADFHKEKIDFLSSFYSPTLDHSVLGQYSGYTQHLAEDGVLERDEVLASTANNSFTPTYAAVALYSRDLAWIGVPFLLTAGKQLNERKAFARVLFNQFMFSNAMDSPSCPVEIIFLIQDEEYHRPGILLSSHFSDLKLDSLVKTIVIENCSYYFLSNPNANTGNNPYIALIGDIFSGKKENFVDTSSLLQSWMIWDPLLKEIQLARHKLDLFTYSPGNLGNLDFHIEKTQLVPHVNVTRIKTHPGLDDPCNEVSGDPYNEVTCSEVSDDPCNKVSGDPYKEVTCSEVSDDPCNEVSGDPCNEVSGDPCNEVSGDPCNEVSGDPYNEVTFNEVSDDPCNEVSDLLVGQLSVIANRNQLAACLAKELKKSATSSISERGVFHLALPGGKSIRTLLNRLSLEYRHAFPWKHTHIWQTDERCVRLNHTESNWSQIDKLLLSQVFIPYHQLHPMPVTLQSGVCASEDKGSGLYSKQLWDVIGGIELDHVVLGVGHDGHIASIFPSSDLYKALPAEDVLLMEATSDHFIIRRRMTLTYQTILSARAISVIITGDKKKELMNMIMRKDEELNRDIPLIKLIQTSRKNQIRLFIDDQIV